MNTPILDFVKKYAASSPTRLHMPGHKGRDFLGLEKYDITEISGADSLYEADGIIKQSEQNASALFGCPTYYSTEGASHTIRAMLFLVLQLCGGRGLKIAAGRNAHKTFVTAAALLDAEVDWITGQGAPLGCRLTPRLFEKYLEGAVTPPHALYITSPDYLGNMQDIRGLSRLCRQRGILLLVDNAHGAYLKFLSESLFPIDLGADICVSSAHKTLPVLTGGAYLHISPLADERLCGWAKNALALFGSTSPSYLILQSLDGANAYMEGAKAELSAFVGEVERLKATLTAAGYTLAGQEPMKITVKTKDYGYLGQELAEELSQRGIVPEFFDPDHLTLMPTPADPDALKVVGEALLGLKSRSKINTLPPGFAMPERALSLRAGITAPCEIVPISRAAGKICAMPTVGCPPAVPIVVSGEIIDGAVISAFEYYSIKECAVVQHQIKP